MKTRNFTQIIYLCVLISFLSSGCTKDAIDIVKGTKLAKERYALGFSLTTESHLTLNSNTAIKNSDIMNIIDEHNYFKPAEFDSYNIYVDMSAGLAPQIFAAQEELGEIVTAFPTATFFGVGGFADDDPDTYQPEDLTEKIKETEKNNTSYFCVGGQAAKKIYDHSWSFLKSAVNACVYSDVENKTINANANLFITDFLLDEGGRLKPYPDKFGNTTTTADPTGWAVDQFKDWFSAGNRLDIVAKKTTIKDGQYGSNGHPKNDKYLYFLFFTPKEYSKSEKLERLLSDLEGMPDVDVLRIDPFSYAIELTDELGPGTDLSYTYTNAKKRNPDIYNVVLDGQQLMDKYQVQFLPFSISMLKDIKEREEGTPPFKNFTLINNFNLQDRNDKESCPYRIKMKADFYQINDFIYELSAIDIIRLEQVPSMTFDSDDYPGNLLPLQNPRDMSRETNAFVFTDSTIQISANMLNQSGSLHVGGKLAIYLCDIVTDRVYFEKTDFYNHDFLDWKHLSYDKQVNVLCLKESVNNALKQLRKEHEGKVIYSYLIGINK